MNIDITALLAGGAKLLPGGEEASDGTFSLELEEKLAEMGLLIPGLVTELAPQPALTPDALAAEGVEGALAPALPEQEGTLAAIAALTTEEGEVSPQWQLQQLIAGNGQAAGAGERLRSELANGVKTPLMPGDEDAGDVLTLKGDKVLKGATMPAALKGTAEAIAPAAQVAADDVAQPEVGSTPEAILPASVSAALPSSPRSPMPVSPQPAVTIPHALETPEWKQAVSQQIVMMSRDGIQSAELRLHPEELGSLHITLRLQQDQAKIHIVSDHAQVRQVMEQAIPQLRAAMADSGIQLGQANVSADNPFAGQNMNGEHKSGEQHAASQGEENIAEEESVPVVLTPVMKHLSGINIFA